MTNKELLISRLNLGGRHCILIGCRHPHGNRTKPSAKELLDIFEGHIADGTLALCDGLRSYHAFPEIADCIVKDCNGPPVFIT